MTSDESDRPRKLAGPICDGKEERGNMDRKNFIIRLDEELNFFVYLRNGQVFGSEFPSAATHFEYGVADEICRRIRDRGYIYAVVCDTRGEPISVAGLKAVEPVSETKVMEYWE
jgi:hypothetical protein